MVERTKNADIHIRVKPEIAREFRVILAKNGQSAQFILERAIKEYIQINGGVIDE